MAKKQARRLMLKDEGKRHVLRKAVERLDKLNGESLHHERFMRAELRRIRKLLGRKPK